MARKQFTFYESYASALRRIKKAADRAKAYDVLCDFALYGIEPDLDALPDAVAIAFSLIKPTLEASAKKAENGKAGGKQTASKREANGKQTASEKENEKENEKEGEKEKEKEKEIENECSLKETYKESPIVEKPIVLKAALMPENRRYYESHG